MQADQNAQEGDLAVVYRNQTQAITETTEFDSCTFPSSVTLPSEVTDNIRGRFRATGSGYFDGNVRLSSTQFRFSGYGDSSDVEVTYTSSDGINYTRTDSGEASISFETTIKYEEDMYEWNDLIGYFMLSGGMYFEGLYEYELGNCDYYGFATSDNDYGLVQGACINLQNNDLGKSFVIDVSSYSDTGRTLKSDSNVAIYEPINYKIYDFSDFNGYILFAVDSSNKRYVVASNHGSNTSLTIKTYTNKVLTNTTTLNDTQIQQLEEVFTNNITTHHGYKIGEFTSSSLLVSNNNKAGIAGCVRIYANDTFPTSYGNYTTAKYINQAVMDYRYGLADTQFTASEDQLLSFVAAYGKTGPITGDGTYINNIPNTDFIDRFIGDNYQTNYYSIIKSGAPVKNKTFMERIKYKDVTSVLNDDKIQCNVEHTEETFEWKDEEFFNSSNNWTGTDSNIITLNDKLYNVYVGYVGTDYSSSYGYGTITKIGALVVDVINKEVVFSNISDCNFHPTNHGGSDPNDVRAFIKCTGYNPTNNTVYVLWSTYWIRATNLDYGITSITSDSYSHNNYTGLPVSSGNWGIYRASWCELLNNFVAYIRQYDVSTSTPNRLYTIEPNGTATSKLTLDITTKVFLSLSSRPFPFIYLGKVSEGSYNGIEIYSLVTNSYVTIAGNNAPSTYGENSFDRLVFNGLKLYKGYDSTSQTYTVYLINTTDNTYTAIKSGVSFWISMSFVLYNEALCVAINDGGTSLIYDLNGNVIEDSQFFSSYVMTADYGAYYSKINTRNVNYDFVVEGSINYIYSNYCSNFSNKTNSFLLRKPSSLPVSHDLVLLYDNTTKPNDMIVSSGTTIPMNQVSPMNFINSTVEQYLADSQTISANTFVEFVNDRLISDASGAPMYVGACLLGTNKVFVLHSGDTNYLYGVVCTIGDTDITVGTDTKLSNNNYSNTGAKIISIGNNRVFITHSYSSSYKLGCMLCTISNNTITVDADVEYSDRSYSNACPVLIDTNKVFVLYSGASSKAYGAICTINNDTLSMSTGVDLTNNSASIYNAIAGYVDTNKVLVLYLKNSKLYGIVCTISGTTITMGTETEILSSLASTAGLYFCMIGNNKCFITHCVNPNTMLYGIVCTISGTTITMGTDTELSTDLMSASSDTCLVSTSTDTVIIAYRASGAMGHLNAMLCTIDNTDITVETDTVMSAGAGTTGFATLTLVDTNKLFITHPENSSSSNLFGKICNIDGTNLKIVSTVQESTTKIDGVTRTQCTSTMTGEVLVLDNSQ